MMFEEFMIIGENYSGWLKVWKGNIEYPYILTIKSPGGGGFEVRIFRTSTAVEMWLDFCDKREDWLV